MTEEHISEKEAAQRIAKGVLKHCDEVSKWARAMNRSLRLGSDHWRAHLRDLDYEMHRNYHAYLLDYQEDDNAEDARATEA